MYNKKVLIIVVLALIAAGLITALYINVQSTKNSTEILNTVPQLSSPTVQTPQTENKSVENTCCTEEQTLASYQEELDKFNYDKSQTDTYNSVGYGFSFDYPKGWTLKQGVKLENWYGKYYYAVELTNTKDFPLRKKEEIAVLLTPKDNWMEAGGEGVSEYYRKLTNASTGKPMYMAIYHVWGIGDFYDRSNDKAYLEKFYAEGEKANNAFMTVAKSLRPF